MSAQHIGSESSLAEDQRADRREDMSSAKSILPPLRERSRAPTGFMDTAMGKRAAGGGKGSNVGSNVATRENTKTEIQSLGLGRKTATLYLSRTHTMVRGKASSLAAGKATPSHGSSQGELSQMGSELLGALGLSEVDRQFTFTGYDIDTDNAPREDITPDGLSEEELLRRKYTRIYLESCRKLGVLPVEPIMKAIADTHVVLKTRGLGVKGAKAIAIALVDNKRVTSLDLEDNWIGAEGADSIAKMTFGNKFITDINIAENRIGTKGIRSLCEALSSNRIVRKLDISGSNLFDHDAKYVALILDNNFCLQELRVRHNKFGELGGLYLGPAIANNEFLEVLDLSWNHLRGKGAKAVAAGVGANVALKVLDISWNGFCSQACKIMGQSLEENNSLRELDISNNRLNADGVGGLMKGVQSNKTLTSLRMGGNPYTPDVATVILRTVIQSEDSALRELDLAEVVIEEEFKILLEAARKKRLLLVKHGPMIKKGESMMREGDAISGFTDPVQALYEYMSQKGYRVIDLFKRFDTDRSMSVTRDEFYSGLVQAHVPMTVGQLEDLMEKLDKDKNGSVDLKELMDGEKLFRRKSIRKKLRRQSNEKALNRKQRAGSLPDLSVTDKRKSSVAGLPSVVE